MSCQMGAVLLYGNLGENVTISRLYFSVRQPLRVPGASVSTRSNRKIIPPGCSGQGLLDIQIQHLGHSKCYKNVATFSQILVTLSVESDISVCRVP